MCGRARQFGIGWTAAPRNPFMSQDFSRSAVPRRLLQIDGRWLLEVEAVEVIDTNILRPVLGYVEGDLAILEELSKQAHGSDLCSAAQRLMREPASSGAPAEDRSFHPNLGKWVAAAFTPPAGLSEHRERSSASSESRSSSSSNQDIDRLSSGHERLVTAFEHFRARVKQLEQQTAGVRHLEQRIAELSEQNAGLLQRVTALESALASGSIAVARTKNVSVVPTQPSEAVAQAVEPQLPPAVQFPPAASLNELLQQLIGDGVNVAEMPKKSAPKFSSGISGWYIATMLDNERRVVGAMLADAKATIQIAGSLIMLPALELQAQLKGKRPSEDVVAAMSEVFNTLTASINVIADNPHIRTMQLAPLDFDKNRWLASPARRLDLQERSGGTLVFLARDPAEIAASG
jgi:hypothetical protein